MSSPARRLVRSNKRGFTLVEIMIVVVIIGILAALAIPGYRRIQRAAQNNRAISDLRTFAQAFETYSLQNGFWPNNVGGGVVPTAPVSMNGDFRTTVWQAQTSIGGRWNWDNSLSSGGFAGIAIQNFTCDDTQLAEIDAKIDDGDLTTGNFQKTAANRVALILAR